MFLLNISSNYRAKFFIGAALNLLSEQGDMYVSEVFSCPDRKGSDAEYYNACVQLTAKTSLDELIILTKEIEKTLGRGSSNMPEYAMPIDIDVLADKQNENWVFLAKRLPLTIDVQVGLQDLGILLDTVDCKTTVNAPVKQDWWDV